MPQKSPLPKSPRRGDDALDSQPSALNPLPSTLYPQPSTFLPLPSPLTPQPEILSPKTPTTKPLTQTLTRSANPETLKVFEDEAAAWEAKLNRVRDALTQWAEIQRRWVYLEGFQFAATHEFGWPCPRQPTTPRTRCWVSSFVWGGGETGGWRMD